MDQRFQNVPPAQTVLNQRLGIDTYTLDLVGNRYGKSHDEPGTANDYTSASAFNSNDQLTAETTTGAGAGTTVYLYDANGSTTSKTVTQAGGLATQTVYGWDLQNRISGQFTGGAVVQLSYDGDGRR